MTLMAPPERPMLDVVEVAVNCRLCGSTLSLDGPIDGTPGILERVRLVCENGHHFVLTLTIRLGAARPAITSPGGERWPTRTLKTPTDVGSTPGTPEDSAPLGD